jgi:hypothetical protein
VKHKKLVGQDPVSLQSPGSMFEGTASSKAQAVGEEPPPFCHFSNSGRKEGCGPQLLLPAHSPREWKWFGPFLLK